MTTAGRLRERICALLMAAGLPGDDAELSARALVIAEGWGIASHGLLRLPYYLERLGAGGINATAALTTVADCGGVVSYNGNCGLGHWQVWRAAEAAAARCRTQGIAACAVANSSHCGALGVYTLPLLDQRLIGLVFSTGPAVMAPWGGHSAVLSTSPIAAGIPCRPQPAIVDLATSTVARGRIAAYAQRGEPLPPGWAVDATGTATTDPVAALAGMLAPLGGGKGFALALLVEALTGAMVGPHLAGDITDPFDQAAAARPQGIGHLVVALDPARFDSSGGWQGRMDELARRVAAAGGRLPGAGRASAGRTCTEPDDDTTIEVPQPAAAAVAEWEERLMTGRSR